MSRILNSVFFLLVIFGMPLVLLIAKKEVVSVDEKRKLATIPDFNYTTYLSGKWAKGVDDYIDDHFPFRSSFIQGATVFHASKGFLLENAEKVVVIPKRPKKVAKETTEEEAAAMKFLDDFEEEYSGSMLIIDGCVYPMGGGSPKMSKSFSKMVSEYAEELKGETRVFSAVAPLSSAFIPVEKYRKYNEQNQRTLAAIGSSLSNGALFCDVFSELNKHVDKKLYFGTDHHWKPIGAYYAYVAFCKTAGFAPVPLDKMEKKVKYNFLGTMYQHTRDPSVKANPDTMEYWVPKVETSAVRYGGYGFNKFTNTKVFHHGCSGGNTYSTFLGGDAPLIRIKTGVKNGKKAVVIKNSMGNAFSVFLISHYQEIWVVDFRYSKQNLIELVRANKIDDMIFAVGMYAAMSNGTINMMRNLAKQSGVYIPKPTSYSTGDSVIPIEQPADSLN